MAMDTENIRTIAAEDAEALAAFYNGLSEASKRTFHPLGDTTTPEACEAIIADNAEAKKLDLVVVLGGRIIGWSFLWSLQAEAPTFGLGVADECHGQGLGSRLMDAVLEQAGSRNIPRIALTVVQDNDRARAMYERRGFVRTEGFTGEDGLPYYYMIRETTPREEPVS